VQAGFSGSCEAVPWVTEPDWKPTFNAYVQYTLNDGNDSMYPCLNALNDGKYAYNNLNRSVPTTYRHTITAPRRTNSRSPAI